MSNKIRIKIDVELVLDLYHNKKLSLNDISKELNINPNTLYYRLKINKIKLRDNSECQRGELNHQFGKRLSYATKKRISNSTKRENNGFFGKHHTKKTKRKIRKSSYHINLLNNKNPFYGKKHNKLSKKQMSLSHGGTGIPYELTEYGVKFNNILRKKVRGRDNYTCKLCGRHQTNLKGRFKKLDVHHIDYDKKNNDIWNLISLCMSCHRKTNFNREYWEKKLGIILWRYWVRFERCKPNPEWLKFIEKINNKCDGEECHL